MLTLFAGTASNGVADHAPDAPIDWPTLKADVIARLNVADEFRELGVRFSSTGPDQLNRMQCHAITRPDDMPSAFVNVATGVYCDRGNGDESMNLFDFAVNHGPFGRVADALKHYAAKAGVPFGKVHAKSEGRILERRYDYCDEAGAVRYAVFRYVTPAGKKTFTQHPSDGRGNWKHGPGCMEGVAPLPYGLPEILASAPSGDPVWVCEGEKAAEAIRSLGLVATTNHGGSANADKTWPGFARHFKGREVYVLPDNDDQGRKAARKVCGHLLGVASVVKLVELPDVPIKGDAVEWIGQGGTAETLGRLAHLAPAWSPEVAAEAEVTVKDLARDATAEDLVEVLSDDSWHWNLWIPKAALVLIAAGEGTGKTRYCMDLHRRMFLGLPWPDGTPPDESLIGRPALWVVADNQHQEIRDIPIEFGIPRNMVYLNTTVGDVFGGTNLETEEQIADFSARIARLKPSAVFIDTINQTSNHKSQDTDSSKRQYKPLQEIAVRQQVSIFCLTHLNNNGTVLGKRANEKVRVTHMLECPDKEGQPKRRRLTVFKSKAIIPPPLGVSMGDDGNTYDDSPPEKPAEDAPASAAVPPKLKECMEWLSARVGNQTVRVSEIRSESDAKGFSANILYKAKDRLGIAESLAATNRKQWSKPAEPPAF